MGEDDETEVVGVEYRDGQTGELVELKADAVVITTGGFGYDFSPESLMAKHRPDLLGVPTTNGSFANGDGMRWGSDLGAILTDMDKVQLHPTAFIDPKDPASHTKYLGPEALRGSGGILLDQQGRRFVNELDLRSKVSQKILDLCEPYKMPDGTEGRPWSWCLLGQEAQEKFGLPMLRFYKDGVGLFQSAEGTKGVAEIIGCPEEAIIQTLREYSEASQDRICSKTGKVVFPCSFLENDNFILAQITPCIHYCMGGLQISPAAEVLASRDPKMSAMGKVTKIRRLFAAGEATGGVHGGNRLGGNSLLECVVFGRIAGERAATIKQPQGGMFSKGEWLPVQLLEVRDTDAKYGRNTMVYRFNLHGSLQNTGLEVGRFIAIRGELDGDTLTGYYSPISRPGDQGIIDILCRTDSKGGPIVDFLSSLQPGASCLMKGMGGCELVRQPSAPVGMWNYNGRAVQKLSLLCGGTGLAPGLQIARAYLNALHGESAPPGGGLKIIYAAESSDDLAFTQAFAGMKARFPSAIEMYTVLNFPPPGWTQGIGFVDPEIIRQRLWYPPADNQLVVMCGPPIFEVIMCKNLESLKYPRDQYYSFNNDPDTLS